MWLNIFKPTGCSSFDIIRQLRPLIKKKMGYAGTLDPLATGVLPLAFNHSDEDYSTKQISQIMACSKGYLFTVQWGIQTDTDDITGKVIAQSELVPDLIEIEKILPQFMGTIKQIPPTYSAIKVNQQRAYKKARNNETFIKPPRFVDIYKLVVKKNQHTSTQFFVECGSGTYVRSLGRDMGILLGCYGTISQLHRTHVGPFLDTEAIPLVQLRSESDIIAVARYVMK